jgi:hypothetical protein
VARRHECEFVVATVASHSNFTSYYVLGRDYFDVDVISSLRAAEAELFRPPPRRQYRALGRSDAPLLRRQMVDLGKQARRTPVQRAEDDGGIENVSNEFTFVTSLPRKLLIADVHPRSVQSPDHLASDS